MKGDPAFHWRRALRFLETARAILEVGDPDSAASRAYYAAYHAVAAHFALEGVTFRRHEAIEAALHRDLIREGRLPVSIGWDYLELRHLRLQGDYAVGRPVDAEAARDAIVRAQRVIEGVRSILSRPLD